MAVGISSWRQRSNNAIPPAVKATASYMNSILAKMEAKARYAEAIVLNRRGLSARARAELSSCATACFPRRRFPTDFSRGITRDTVLSGRRPGDPAVEEPHPQRPAIADEVFMTGSAAELTPVKVPWTVASSASPGEITRAAADRFFDLAYGRIGEYADWLTEV